MANTVIRDFVDITLEPGKTDATKVTKAYDDLLKAIGNVFSAKNPTEKSIKDAMEGMTKEVDKALRKMEAEIKDKEVWYNNLKSQADKAVLKNQIETEKVNLLGYKNKVDVLKDQLAKLSTATVKVGKYDSTVKQMYDTSLADREYMSKLTAEQKRQVQEYAAAKQAQYAEVAKINKVVKRDLNLRNPLFDEELVNSRTYNNNLLKRLRDEGDVFKRRRAEDKAAQEASLLSQASLQASLNRGDIRQRASGVGQRVTDLIDYGKSNVKTPDDLVRQRSSVAGMLVELRNLEKAGQKAGMSFDFKDMKDNLKISTKHLGEAVNHVKTYDQTVRQIMIGVRGFFRYAIVYGAGFQALSAVSNYIGGLVKFTDQIKELQAIAQATDKDMVGLSSAIKDVAANSAFGIGDVAKSAVVLAQAGTELKDMPAALKAVSDFATATGSTLETAADTVTSAAMVFKDQSFTEVADKLTAAINVSKLTADSLKTVMSLGAQTAKASGADLGQFLGVSATLANAGIRPQTVATGTRQLTLEVFSPDPQTIDFLKKRYAAMGENLSEAQIKAQMFAMKNAPNPYVAFLNELKRIGVSGEARDEFRRVIDVRAENALLPLLDNLDKLAETTAKINVAGTAAEGAATRVESLSAAFTKLGNNVMALGDTVTAGSQKMVASAVSLISDGINKLRQASNTPAGQFAMGAAKFAVTATPVYIMDMTEKVISALRGTQPTGQADKVRESVQAAQAAYQKALDQAKANSPEGDAAKSLANAGQKAADYQNMLYSGKGGKELEQALTEYEQGISSLSGYISGVNERVLRILERQATGKEVLPEEAALVKMVQGRRDLFASPMPDNPNAVMGMVKDLQDAMAAQFKAEMDGRVATLKGQVTELNLRLARMEVLADKTGELTRQKAVGLAASGNVEGLDVLVRALRAENRDSLANETGAMMGGAQAAKAKADKIEADRKANEELGKKTEEEAVKRSAAAQAKLTDWRNANMEAIYKAEKSQLDIAERINKATDVKDYEALAKLIQERADNERTLLSEELKQKEVAFRDAYLKTYNRDTLPDNLNDMTAKQWMDASAIDEIGKARDAWKIQFDLVNGLNEKTKLLLDVNERNAATSAVQGRLDALKAEAGTLQARIKEAGKDGNYELAFKLIDEKMAVLRSTIVQEREQARLARSNVEAADLEYKERMKGVDAIRENLIQENIKVVKAKKFTDQISLLDSLIKMTEAQLLAAKHVGDTKTIEEKIPLLIGIKKARSTAEFEQENALGKESLQSLSAQRRAREIELISDEENLRFKYLKDPRATKTRQIKEGVDTLLDLNKTELEVAADNKEFAKVGELIKQRVGIVAAQNALLREQDLAEGKKPAKLVELEFTLREKKLAFLQEELLQDKLGAQWAKKNAAAQEKQADKLAKINDALSNAREAYVKAKDAAAAHATAVENRKLSFEEARAAIKGDNGEPASAREGIQARLDALAKRQGRGDFAKGAEDAMQIKDSIVAAKQAGTLDEWGASGLLNSAEQMAKKSEGKKGDMLSNDMSQAVSKLQTLQEDLATATSKMAELKKEAEALAQIKVGIDKASLEQVRQDVFAAVKGSISVEELGNRLMGSAALVGGKPGTATITAKYGESPFVVGPPVPEQAGPPVSQQTKFGTPMTLPEGVAKLGHKQMTPDEAAAVLSQGGPSASHLRYDDAIKVSNPALEAKTRRPLSDDPKFNEPLPSVLAGMTAAAQSVSFASEPATGLTSDSSDNMAPVNIHIPGMNPLPVKARPSVLKEMERAVAKANLRNQGRQTD